MSAEPTDIDEAILLLRRAFQPERAAGVLVCYLIELAGPAGGKLWVRVDGEHLLVGADAAQQPDVVVRLDAQDFFGILGGRENPDLLFMADRLVVEGDLSLALKLRSLFRAPA